MKKLSFVIPCYGSEHTIENVVNEIKEVVRMDGRYTYEIILVSDGSPDNVFGVISNICSKMDNVKGFRLTKNFGQHAALMAGYHFCEGDIIISLDDDGQIPVNEVFSLIDKIDEGFDVVYGTYQHKKHNRFRNFGTMLNNWMAEWLLDKPKDLMLTSYFAMTSVILKEVIRYDQAFPYIMGLVLRSTNRIASVPVNHRSRVTGSSGYTFKKLIGLWFNAFTAFSVKPLRFATLTGLVFAGSGLLYAIVTVFNKMFNPNVPVGWSSTMFVLLVLGGMILTVLGLIGEYVGRIYICINKSPQYVVAERVSRKQ